MAFHVPLLLQDLPRPDRVCHVHLRGSRLVEGKGKHMAPRAPAQPCPRAALSPAKAPREEPEPAVYVRVSRGELWTGVPNSFGKEK